MTITHTIRETLRNSGLTQTELAEKTHVSQSIICDFLKGSSVNSTTLDKFAVAFSLGFVDISKQSKKTSTKLSKSR